MIETWRPVRGFEDRYEVSDHGRVRSVDRLLKCRGDGVVRHRGRILSQTASNGYPRVALGVGGGDSVRARVHVLVLEAFVGPRPEGMEARHLDGDRTNNRVGNLRWSDHLTNMRDKADHGTVARGEAQGSARLTADAVRAIRSARRSGLTLAEIGRQFGIAFQTVSKIVNGRSWAHVQEAP